MKNEFDEIMKELSDGPFSVLSDRAMGYLKMLIMKVNSIGYAVGYKQGYDDARRYAEKSTVDPQLCELCGHLDCDGHYGEGFQ